MKFEIKNWLNGNILFTIEGESWKAAFTAAVEAGQEFNYANLSGKEFKGMVIKGGRFTGSSFTDSRFTDSSFTDSSFTDSRFTDSSFTDSSFTDSSFTDSSFTDSSFTDSSFTDSSFTDSSFTDSSFTDSSFTDSSFTDSSFTDSSFTDSSFTDSSFTGSRFTDSSFTGSSFTGSRFTDSSFDAKTFQNLPAPWLIACRDDLWSILITVPAEVKFLRQALVDGKVDGSTYTGECRCLVGTLAAARKCEYNQLEIVKPNAFRPAESFFFNIRPGGTPAKNPFAKLALGWIDEFVALQNRAAEIFGK